LIKFSDTNSILPDETIVAVVAGFDMNINYKKIAKAFTYLKNPNCMFIATNVDPTYPIPHSIMPGNITFKKTETNHKPIDVVLKGAGALIAPLIEATGRQPIILGKPYQGMLDIIRKRYKNGRN
jgi:4-nitrophenyl phosphatase